MVVGGDKKFTKFTFIFSLGVVVAFLLLLLFSTIFYYFLTSQSNNFESQKRELNEYRYRRINTLTFSTSSAGFVRIFDDLSPEEFIHEVDGNIQTLISHFDSTEYICHGECHCTINEEEEHEERRRRIGGIIRSKSLVYLLSSVSSFLALKKAKEYFEDVCTNEDICVSSSSNIHTEINHCERVNKDDKGVGRQNNKEEEYTLKEGETFGGIIDESFYKDQLKQQEELDNEDYDDSEPNVNEQLEDDERFMQNKVYLCKGNCLDGGKEARDQIVDYLLFKYGKNREREEEGEAMRDPEDIVNPEPINCESFQLETKVIVPGVGKEHEDEIAPIYFIDFHLRDFCKNAGLKIYGKMFHEESRFKEQMSASIVEDICLSFRYEKSDYSDLHNPTIKCVFLYKRNLNDPSPL